MAALAQDQAADFALIRADLGNPVFTWSGADYGCIPSGASKSKKLEAGGFSLDSDLVLKALKSAFAAGVGPFPTEKQTVTFRSVAYRIQKVTANESDVFLVLHCDSSKGGV